MAIRNIRQQQPAAILEEELAPGFSRLPDGRVMYQVATDYPKQMAQIGAGLDALYSNMATRTIHPSITPEQLKATEGRLRSELSDFESNLSGISQESPRYFETKKGIVQVIPRTGSTKTVFETPEGDVAGDKRRQVESGILAGEIRNLGALKLKSKRERLGGPSDADIDAEIAKKRLLLDELFGINQPPVLADPAPQAVTAPAQPQRPSVMTIGNLDATPTVLSATNAPTAARPTVRIVRDANGNLVIAK